LNWILQSVGRAVYLWRRRYMIRS